MTTEMLASAAMAQRRGPPTAASSSMLAEPDAKVRGTVSSAGGMGEDEGVAEGLAPGLKLGVGVGVLELEAVSVGSAVSLTVTLALAVLDTEPLCEGEPLEVFCELEELERLALPVDDELGLALMLTLTLAVRLLLPDCDAL